MNKLIHRTIFSAATLGGLAAANQGKFGEAEVKVAGDYLRVHVMREGPLRQVWSIQPSSPNWSYDTGVRTLFGDPPDDIVRSNYYLRPVRVTWLDSTGKDRSGEVTYH